MTANRKAPAALAPSRPSRRRFLKASTALGGGLVIGFQMTGGSQSVASSWEQLRMVGAQARTMLVQAAANEWKVPVAECRAEKGEVIHTSGKKLAYGALADAANKLPLPEGVKLKDPKDFKLIGKTTKRIDAREKSI